MKKFLGIILAMALMLTLVSVVPAFAVTGDMFNVDWFKLINEEGGDIEVLPLVGSFDVSAAPVTGFLGNVKSGVDAGAKYIYFVGWYMPLKELAYVGIKVDGGELTDEGFTSYQQELSDALAGMGFENSSFANRITATLPILEGAHTLDIVAKFADGEEKVVYSASYFNGENVALGKTVYVDGGYPADATYWRPEFLVDGVAQDTTNGNALGWAFGTPIANGTDIDVSAYVDLGAVYAVDSMIVVPMQWSWNATFPGAFKLYVSADGTNWTCVGEGVGSSATKESIPFKFEAVNARYVRLQALSYNGAWADAATYYHGFGDLEVFGTKVSESSSRSPFLPLSNYKGAVTANPGEAAWTGFTTGDLDFTFSFRTDVPVRAMGFPSFWGSAGTSVKFTFTQDDNKVLEFDTVFNGDGAKVISFPTELPKGEYDCTITINEPRELTDDEKTSLSIDLGITAYAQYFVIGMALENAYGADYCTYERGQGLAIDIYSNNTESNKLGFVTFDYIEPTVSPATADASMVVFIVAAAAIALVILKKKQFF